MDVQTGSPPSTAFFHHGPGGDPRTGPMQNLTRYLCAAMYLDKGMCDAVLKEYVYESYRAVVPSHGFDLEPVIRHARQARRMRIVRDVLIVGLWPALLTLSPLYVLFHLGVLGYLTALFRVPWRRLSWRTRIGLAVVVPALILVAGLALTAAALQPGATASAGEWLGFLVSGLIILAFASAMTSGLFAFVVIGHLTLVLRRLARNLGPGAHGPGPDVGGSARFGNALAHVRASQGGNITLYAGDNPFIGAGHPHSPDARIWSIALELDRKAANPLGKPAPSGTAARSVIVDPVVMHERIRAKLHEMRDELPQQGGNGQRPPGDGGERPLPPNERINGLVTGWHVVARGRCVQHQRPVDDLTPGHYSGHPLVDPHGRVPFSAASEAAVEAAVRHPQGGIRCFQRVSIGAQGQSIRTPDAVVVAPAEDQDAVMSAFVHLAVEGRMLYGLFAATVLPPVHPVFKVVDELPGWRGGKVLWKAIRIGLPSVFVAPLLAPSRLAAALWRIARETFTAETAPDPATEFVHDYGSRISVRELAADADFQDFVQEIDVDKYTRLIERRVNEALLDYLGDECGIDVSAYRTQAGVIMNEGVIMTGGTVHGQVAAGQRVQQRQSGAGGTGGGRGGRINP
ncbi:hypothetical protein E1287_35270 [Actinomadura sp. KC06]|uniref:hypothetical protein n=1 Tax=Actinomadura sp. KC06 TaxID=2530369 RepID=UPI001048B0E9|nr:hypothetical protein [Actinomadura sp. KC06]TDD27092.1 hypothetical protein E1287_35270 [Actinomadura sp. KC06]